MSRICPNCHYTRKPTDSAPDWQCPACEIAYNKGAGAAATESYGRYVAPPIAKSSSGFAAGKWLLILAVLVAGVWLGKPLWQAKTGLAASAVTRNGEQPEVVLYATTWCGYCAATREFFVANGISYTELDIEKTSAGQEGHRRLGGNGVPLIVVGDEVIHGYNEAALRSTLKPWLKGS